MEGEENGLDPGEPELQLRRCLDARTRRWAAAEFFCSGLDRPWFLQNELQVMPDPHAMLWKPDTYDDHLR